MFYRYENNSLSIDRKELDIYNTLYCGQVFRFDPLSDARYMLIASDRALFLEQKDDISLLYPVFEEDLGYWMTYFDLDVSYEIILKNLCQKDKKLKLMHDEFSGIRILRQDLFEMTISFIISQNNNIPRIKKIIDKLCSSYGDEKFMDGITYHAFPTREQMLDISTDAYHEMGLGYRSEYLYETVKALSDDFLEEIKTNASTRDEKLMSLHGVGPKVKNCITLFGLHDLSSYPVDTWIKKVLQVIYGVDNKSRIDELIKGYDDYPGIAQQYQFFYARNHKELFEEGNQ